VCVVEVHPLSEAFVESSVNGRGQGYFGVFKIRSGTKEAYTDRLLYFVTLKSTTNYIARHHVRSY
jgi:hypothetical protein